MPFFLPSFVSKSVDPFSPRWAGYAPPGFLEVPTTLEQKGIWVCSAEPRIMAMPYKLYREPQNWIKDVEGVGTVYMLCKST